MLLPFGASSVAQTTLIDDEVVEDLNQIAGSSTNYPASEASPKYYIIGGTSAYDTDFDNLPMALTGYTELLVQNGSTVEGTDSSGLSIDMRGANSSITVTGANTELLLSVISSADGISIQSNLGNTVQVLDGGYLKMKKIALSNNSSGSFEIDGANSTLETIAAISMRASSSVSFDIANGGIWKTTNFTDTDGSLTLNLNNGGMLQTSEAFNVSNIDTFNFNSGATLIAQAAVSNLGTIQSGRTVDISNGGSFATASTLDGGSLNTGDFALANLTFTSGALVSTGELTNLPELVSGHSVDISNGGSLGDATTLNGGTLTTGAFDANNLTFTSGTLESSGALTNLPELVSGHIVDITSGGSFNEATTLNGGTVNAADLDATNLTFTAGTITATGELSNLETLNANNTVLLDGGTWSPTGNIDDGHTTIQKDATLSVIGDFDGSNLTFTGGSLSVAGDASNLPEISAGRSVELTGGGNLLTATTLNGGTFTGGDFNIGGNLTFTAGTLNVNGTLQNLTHLPMGTAVNMSGASADLILSQDLVITGGTLNVDDGASVTVLNDVTLGAGSIGFDSNGGRLDLGGGKLNVASMDTALALNANASITGHGSIYGDINLATGGTISGDKTGITVFGEISGSGTLSNLTLYGSLDIGNSPGEMNLEGVTLGPGTEVTMEIMGTEAGEFDILIGDGDTDVSGANLSIIFSAYVPTGIDTWQLISGDMDPLSFANISTPEGWELDSDGYLSAVPEPSSFALIFGSLALLVAAQRRPK
ncbi:beta strand repeat-containing protein [Coraliomargarita sp. W4R53]